MADSLLLMNHK